MKRSSVKLACEIWIGRLRGDERDGFQGRFLSMVDSAGPDECWLWTGTVNSNGYGKMRVHGEHIGAHRIAFILDSGVVPVQRLVCHTCDQPPCVNPNHLYAGTFSDNLQDAIDRGVRSVPIAEGRRYRFPRGEKNPSSKIGPQEVRRIRALHSDGKSYRAIAAKYDLSDSTVGRIVRREYWPQVE